MPLQMMMNSQYGVYTVAQIQSAMEEAITNMIGDGQLITTVELAIKFYKTVVESDDCEYTLYVRKIHESGDRMEIVRLYKPEFIYPLSEYYVVTPSVIMKLNECYI